MRVCSSSIAFAIILSGMPCIGDAKCYDPDCAGNGVCTDGECVCNEGYSGKDTIIDLGGDQPAYGSNCQVSDLVVSLCALNLVFCPIAMFISLIRASSLYYNRKKKFDNMVILCLTGSAAQLIQLFNYLLISVFDHHLYDSLALSLGLGIWGFFYWPSVFLYIYMMLPITAMSKVEGETMQKIFKPALIANSALGAFGFLVPYTLAFHMPWMGQTWAVGCYLTLGATCVGMGYIFYKVLGRIAGAVKPEKGATPIPANVARYKKYTMIRRGCAVLCFGSAFIFWAIPGWEYARIRGGHLFFNIASVFASLAWMAMMMVFKAPQSKFMAKVRVRVGSVVPAKVRKSVMTKNKVAPAPQKQGDKAKAKPPGIKE